MRNKRVNIGLLVNSIAITIFLIVSMGLFFKDMIDGINPTLAFVGVIGTALGAIVSSTSASMTWEECHRELK